MRPGGGGAGEEGGDALRQEELEVLVREMAQLVAQRIVDADMVRVPPGAYVSCCSGSRAREGCRPLVAEGREGRERTHERYATVRDGSWLKLSDSISRSSSFHAIEKAHWREKRGLGESFGV